MIRGPRCEARRSGGPSSKRVGKPPEQGRRRPADAEHPCKSHRLRQQRNTRQRRVFRYPEKEGILEDIEGAGKFKPYLIIALTDETYSLLCDGKCPEGADPHRFRFFVSLFNQCFWVAGSAAGSLLGTVLPFSTMGIEFSMTALFIASFTEQWITTGDHVPALTGLIGTAACLLIFGPEHFLIPAMLFITLVLTILPRLQRPGRKGGRE